MFCSTFAPVLLSVYLVVGLCICLFVCLSICLFVCLFVCLFINYLSFCLFICLSISLFACLSVSLFFYLSSSSFVLHAGCCSVTWIEENSGSDIFYSVDSSDSCAISDRTVCFSFEVVEEP